MMHQGGSRKKILNLDWSKRQDRVALINLLISSVNFQLGWAEFSIISKLSSHLTIWPDLTTRPDQQTTQPLNQLTQQPDPRI